jgi:hypothetical protein
MIAGQLARIALDGREDDDRLLVRIVARDRENQCWLVESVDDPCVRGLVDDSQLIAEREAQ